MMSLINQKKINHAISELGMRIVCDVGSLFFTPVLLAIHFLK